MTIAGDLAQWATNQSYADLPPKTIDYAAMLIASTIASASFGSTLDSSKIVMALEKERGGTPEATLWFDGGRLPIVAVGRVNALMSDAAASDDSDLRNITHPGTTVAATTLAVAERTGSSGQDILAAMVLGYEVAGRINGAVVPGLREKGFHGCVIAVFAGAVAAGRLLGLNQAQMAQAIAISATSVGGLMAAANTSVAREYHAGNAAMQGINAALAAQRGYIAEERILEAPAGFFEVFGQGNSLEPVTSDFGTRWDILTEMAIKLVPGGNPSHALGEASANAAKMGNVSADEIETITMSRPGYHALHGERSPTTLIGIAHSPTYFLAAGAADKDFSWVHATEEKINDPVIRSLFDKVRVGPPPTENVERYKQGVTVTIQTKDGRSYTSTVFAPRGAAINGIEWSDVESKYRTLVPFSGLSSDKVEASLKVIRAFRDVKNVSELVNHLH